MDSAVPATPLALEVLKEPLLLLSRGRLLAVLLRDWRRFERLLFVELLRLCCRLRLLTVAQLLMACVGCCERVEELLLLLKKSLLLLELLLKFVRSPLPLLLLLLDDKRLPDVELFVGCKV